MGTFRCWSTMPSILSKSALLGLASSAAAFFTKPGDTMMATPAEGAAHPTLPTMWTATVKEDEVGIVRESETFVWHVHSASNPSAKWTNFTDGSCQRLIYASNNFDGARYLFGCDAVDCCYEEDSGDGPMEYQIPDVHPAAFAPVSSLGKEQITTFDGKTVTADVWSWKFGPENKTVWTTPAPGNSSQGVLVKWNVAVEGKNFPNEYVNYTAVPASEAAAFIATFNPPSQQECSMSCPDAFKAGKLSQKSLNFLRQKQRTSTFRAKTTGSTCTGPHESCCPAPMNDPNNCPASARTSDCDAKKSCCCG